ncbi:hypothetical protein ACO0K9_27805 [Undibacterium sp. Ji50W]|uniref:hypothetical protein n=1 Tax=Undibacterium sp. Ji50W TaxID=3413041 RepID=UPI003BF3EBBA
MRGHNILITEAELIASTSERVYSILEIRAARRDRNDPGFDMEVEKALLDRKDPLIDLALARFGKYNETMETLFKKFSGIDLGQTRERALRLAVLANEHLDGVLNFDCIPNALFGYNPDGIFLWLSKASDEELFAMFGNPALNESFLRDFLEGKASWQAMGDERRQTALRALANNKRMGKQYSGDMDGYAEFLHGQVFSATWKLAETLPATKGWAVILGNLLSKTRCEPFHAGDPLLIAERWRPAIDDAAGQTEEDELAKNGYAWGYTLVRKSLAHLAAKTKPDLRKELLKHRDPAIRDAIYTFYDMTSDEVLAAYYIDKNLAVNSCQQNDYVWRRPDSRKALHDISWKACGELNNNYLDSANAYNFWEAEKRKSHPDWFKDEEENSEVVVITPVTKADIETLVEAVGSNEHLIREGILLATQTGKTVSTILTQLGWVWWFSLGALVASFLHRF